MFEQEAVRAFTMWRKNGGTLADIDIYAVCITKNTISEHTKQKFAELGVNYIEAYHPETETFDCGFFNKPLGCAYLERTLPHDILIHIDLDMYLMREPVLKWVNSCMVYDRIQRQQERIHHNEVVDDTYNTCLVVAERKTMLFSKWWEILAQLHQQYLTNRQHFDDAYSNLDYRKLEELAFDILSTTIPIHDIPNAIFGETYTSIAEMSPHDFAQVYFHHYHIYPQLYRYNWLKDIREWKARLA